MALDRKVASSKLKYFVLFEKKSDCARRSLVRESGPSSANDANSTKITVNHDNFRKRNKILAIFYLFFIILDIFKLQSCWKSL